MITASAAHDIRYLPQFGSSIWNVGRPRPHPQMPTEKSNIFGGGCGCGCDSKQRATAPGMLWNSRRSRRQPLAHPPVRSTRSNVSDSGSGCGCGGGCNKQETRSARLSSGGSTSKAGGRAPSKCGSRHSGSQVGSLFGGPPSMNAGGGALSAGDPALATGARVVFRLIQGSPFTKATPLGWGLVVVAELGLLILASDTAPDPRRRPEPEPKRPAPLPDNCNEPPYSWLPSCEEMPQQGYNLTRAACESGVKSRASRRGGSVVPKHVPSYKFRCPDGETPVPGGYGQWADHIMWLQKGKKLGTCICCLCCEERHGSVLVQGMCFDADHP